MKKIKTAILFIAIIIFSTTFQSCDYDKYMFTGISRALIYSPGSVIALEYVDLSYEQGGAVCYPYIQYDTLYMPQYVEQCGVQFPCKEQERKKWKIFKSAPDYQYLKITRLSGINPVFVTTDLMLYVNDSLVVFPSESLTTDSIEKIVNGLRAINRGYYWDDSKQHKISRFASDWSLDPEHQKDSKTAITID